MSAMDIAVSLRKKFMKLLRDISDPGYYILSKKTAPLSQE
jgi:hypothetical protein